MGDSEGIVRPLSAVDLERVSALTLAHYEASAESFREGTRDHDVSQNYAALLGAIEGPAPFTILDFGCRLAFLLAR